MTKHAPSDELVALFALIIGAIRGGKPVNDACKEAGVDKKQFCDWLMKCRDEELKAIQDAVKRQVQGDIFKGLISLTVVFVLVLTPTLIAWNKNEIIIAFRIRISFGGSPCGAMCPGPKPIGALWLACSPATPKRRTRPPAGRPPRIPPRPRRT